MKQPAHHRLRVDGDVRPSEVSPAPGRLVERLPGRPIVRFRTRQRMERRAAEAGVVAHREARRGVEASGRRLPIAMANRMGRPAVEAGVVAHRKGRREVEASGRHLPVDMGNPMGRPAVEAGVVAHRKGSREVEASQGHLPIEIRNRR